MVSPDKTYSVKEENYDGSKNRISTKTSVINALDTYSEHIIGCRADSYNPSQKLGPQGQMKAQEYPKIKSITPEYIKNEIESWSGKVLCYAKPIDKSKGTQEIFVNLLSGYSTTYKYRFIVNANKIAWV